MSDQLKIDVRPFVKRINTKILNFQKQPISEHNHVFHKNNYYKVILYEVKRDSMGVAFYEDFPSKVEIKYPSTTLLRLEKDEVNDRILFGFYIPEGLEQVTDESTTA